MPTVYSVSGLLGLPRGVRFTDSTGTDYTVDHHGWYRADSGSLRLAQGQKKTVKVSPVLRSYREIELPVTIYEIELPGTLYETISNAFEPVEDGL
jgi:hypothetical protein